MNPVSLEVNEILNEYLNKCEYDEKIKNGMKYVLKNGKRIRSSITLSMMKNLNPRVYEKSKFICLVPEFIHTSSLIIDDLPAFDNAEYRRGQKCIHLVENEGIAYLIAFNLITESLMLLHENLKNLNKIISMDNLYDQYVNNMLTIIDNISGSKLILGQLKSTFNNKNINSYDEMLNIISKKTYPFFEIAILIGWISSFGDSEKIPQLKRLSYLVGLCYQIKDDFDDLEEDIMNNNCNYVTFCGREKSIKDFENFKEEINHIIIKNEFDFIDLEFLFL